MIEGSRWRTWVFYNIPLILFVFALLFPFYWMIVTSFRPDSELYRPGSLHTGCTPIKRRPIHKK
jgi:multiple sugar transport system permease protein